MTLYFCDKTMCFDINYVKVPLNKKSKHKEEEPLTAGGEKCSLLQSKARRNKFGGWIPSLFTRGNVSSLHRHCNAKRIESWFRSWQRQFFLVSLLQYLRQSFVRITQEASTTGNMGTERGRKNSEDHDFTAILFSNTEIDGEKIRRKSNLDPIYAVYVTRQSEGTSLL